MRKFLPLILLIGLTACDDGRFDNKEFAGITPVLAGESPLASFGPQYVWVKGIWSIEGENSASPYNVTEYQCWRSEMTCRSASADLTDWGGHLSLDVWQEVLPIDDWTADHLSIKTGGGCRDVQTTISAKNNSVTQIVTSNLTRKTCVKDGAGKPYQETLTNPRKLRMLNLEEFQNRYEPNWFAKIVNW